MIFLGTPEFAVPSLEALARLRESGTIDLVAAITRPDRPAHRGRITAPAVKAAAQRLGVPVSQPEKLRAAEAIVAFHPDVLVWAAYGAIVPRAFIDHVRGRAVNVHPSLLPRWRGAEPVAWAILSGDRETGVTLMEGTADLDAGPILAQERVPIDDENTGVLEAGLARLGARMLEELLPRYLRGDVVGKPQDPTAATYAPKLDPAKGELDFARPVDELVRIVRAFTPSPGAFFLFRGSRVLVTRATVTGGSPKEHGVFELRDGIPHLAAGAGWLRLDQVKPAGRTLMSGADWARGAGTLNG